MIRARALLITVVSVLTLALPTTARAQPPPCSGRVVSTCGGVTADQSRGDFHGLIAITGHPDVFAMSARSGTTAGCADCVWSLVTACAQSDPGNGGGTLCHGAVTDPNCRRGVLERLFLTDSEVTFEYRATLCIRAGEHVVPVGDIARADVDRYLKDVRPPRLIIRTSPRGETLAGLPTYFTAVSPHQAPRPFGGPQVSEAITIAASRTYWTWGDGQSSGWTAVSTRQTHRYVHGGIAHGRLTAIWGATYTITFDGATYGPYDATGQLTRSQDFTLPVDTSSPRLVSHG